MFLKAFLIITIWTGSAAQAAPSKKKVYTPTAEEKRIIAAADEEFAKALFEPPPSINMQMKMQSSVPLAESMKKPGGEH